MLYQDTVGQAQVPDDFWLLAILFSVIPFFLPLMRRVRADRPAEKEPDADSSGRVPTLPAATWTDSAPPGKTPARVACAVGRCACDLPGTGKKDRVGASGC
jgi:hypothetical protein